MGQCMSMKSMDDKIVINIKINGIDSFMCHKNGMIITSNSCSIKDSIFCIQYLQKVVGTKPCVENPETMVNVWGPVLDSKGGIVCNILTSAREEDLYDNRSK